MRLKRGEVEPPPGLPQWSAELVDFSEQTQQLVRARARFLASTRATQTGGRELGGRLVWALALGAALASGALFLRQPPAADSSPRHTLNEPRVTHAPDSSAPALVAPPPEQAPSEVARQDALTTRPLEASGTLSLSPRAQSRWAQAFRPVVPTALRQEVELTEQMRRALGSHPATALSLIGEARRRFPAGALIEERNAFEIFALRALGRHAEARSRGERFLRHHAGSPFFAKVKEIVRSN